MIYTQDAIKKKKEKRRKLKNRIVIIVYIIVIPLLLYNISLIIQSVVNSEETPEFFGIKTFVIISGSMEPEIEIGDIVIVKEADNYEVGDIISFRQGQNIITHRISEIEEVDGEIRYRTKGDNNNTEDSGTITPDVIEGKVVNIIPFIGKVIFLLKDKVTIIVILILLYIYISHSGKVKERKLMRRKKRIEYENNKSEK